MGIESSQDCPSWLSGLLKKIADTMLSLSFSGQLGFRYLPQDDENNQINKWVLAVYLLPNEVSGGRDDGALAVPGFSLDLVKLTSLFSEVKSMGWTVPRVYNDGLDGPEVWIEGLVDDNKISFHFYADPPFDESPELILDFNEDKVRPK